MEIIEVNKSGLVKGRFLNSYLFEDDTIVYENEEGLECENFNNTHTDNYYINLVKTTLLKRGV